MNVEFSEIGSLFQAGRLSECAARLVDFVAGNPSDPDAHFLLALLSNASDRSRSSLVELINPIFSDASRSAEAYERLGNSLRTAGLEKLALFAFKAAAEKDKSNGYAENAWGNFPFNGQQRRIEFFPELLKVVKPNAIVETGSFRGTTTEFFSKNFEKAIYSCELSDRFFEAAASKLASYENVHLFKTDSRNLLRQLADTGSFRQGPVFFYLDAHWNADLPLRDELKIIFANFDDPVIMIDDFEVPADGGFGFDDYGVGAILSLEILHPVVPEQASLFFPQWSATDETEPRRGFIIIALDGSSEKIRSCLSNYLTETSELSAAIIQMLRYRRMYRDATASEATCRQDSAAILNARETELATLRALREEESRKFGNEIRDIQAELESTRSKLQNTKTELEKRTKLRRRMAAILGRAGSIKASG